MGECVVFVIAGLLSTFLGLCFGAIFGIWLARKEKEMLKGRLGTQFDAIKEDLLQTNSAFMFFVAIQRLGTFIIARDLLSDPSFYEFYQKYCAKIFAGREYNLSLNEVKECKSDLLKLEIKKS